MYGTLYVVSTPIGNLKDITQRALDTLASVELILAEDTRHTAKLLSHYQIKTPSTSFHEHSGKKKIDWALAKLKEGKNLALVSDSGTPLVSDPGFPLVRAARAEGIPVAAIPGASALLTAVAAAGVALERFVFEGFLPPKGSARGERLEKIRTEESTMVLYESPYHVIKLLENLREILGGERAVVIARELTKLHEEFVRGTVGELIEKFSKQTPRGEFVVIIPKRRSGAGGQDSGKLDTDSW
ncbi:MAG: 16S rRNA (cytidine(1402)-2'-O)-methyltransferase [Candidatus Omnitrophica bacterium]|nr:16S rRNA (cytidine(1402)-2'-O)-methyltransferase [Candidatus Omnitrophota bacterium]